MKIDEFPDDASRSCTVSPENSVAGTTADCDNDGAANDMDNCPAFASSDMTDGDGDTIGNVCDVDDDNNGLIEIATAEELDNVRYNLLGTSYKTSADDSGDATGAPPASESTVCSASRRLCGYELTANIDLSDIANWQPIGTGTGFNANFNGNGNLVSNMAIVAVDVLNEPNSHLGLFGFVNNFAGTSSITISNLHVEGRITYRGTKQLNIGGLIGTFDTLHPTTPAMIDGCSSAVNIIGGDHPEQRIGGLIGTSSGVVQNSWASGDVYSCGGNLADSGSCTSTGCTCEGGAAIGGLIGRSTGSVRNSYATGAVRGSSELNEPDIDTGIGGLIGYALMSVMNSYATGDVVGGGGVDNIGGLIGRLGSTVENSYATGNVDDGDIDTVLLHVDKIGGFVGLTEGTVDDDSYYSGTVTGTSLVLDGPLMVNGDELVEDGAQIAQTAATALQSPDSVGGIYAGWSADDWEFGTTTDFPALKSFIDADGDDTNDGGTLLCGQPVPRAQCE